MVGGSRFDRCSGRLEMAVPGVSSGGSLSSSVFHFYLLKFFERAECVSFVL